MKDQVKDTVQKKIKTSLELQIILSKVYHSQTRFFYQFMKKWNLSLPQYAILTQLREHRQLSQNELAANLCVSKGNVSQLIQKLEQAGWVVREQQWKTKSLSLTASGAALVEEIEPERNAFLLQHYQNMPRKKQKQLIQLMKTLDTLCSN
ncbi:MAG: MarR family transcriptional regulator [Sporolactobacillus sp.]